jgi:rubrerythrin
MWGMPESPEFSAVQRLLHEFQDHEAEEGRWLSAYKKIAEESGDPRIRFLLSLIVADEEKHQELMGRVVSSLKDDLTWTRAEKSAPDKGGREEEGKALLDTIGRFLEVERSGIREYEKLNKASQGFHHDLYALLCKTMVHDSLKHIGILEYLELKLRQEQASAQRRKK